MLINFAKVQEIFIFYGTSGASTTLKKKKRILLLIYSQHNSREEVYRAAGEIANRYTDYLDSKGATLTHEDILYLISENKSVSQAVARTPLNTKSTAITGIRRLSKMSRISIIKIKIKIKKTNRHAELMKSLIFRFTK